MDINKYALFADIAETLNFTQSGENMGYNTQSVSFLPSTKSCPKPLRQSTALRPVTSRSPALPVFPETGFQKSSILSDRTIPAWR